VSSQPSPDSPASPEWSSTTKLVFGLTFVALVAALLIRFRFIVGPLILAFVLAYLLIPLVSRVSKTLRLSWGAAVNLVFLMLVIILAVLIFLLGLAVVQQIQSLYAVLVTFIQDLPGIVEDISQQSFQFGSFVFSLNQYNLENIVNQVLPNLQTPLGRIGSLITSFAGGTLGTLGWVLFTVVVAYFLLAEANTVSGVLLPIEIPHYQDDLVKMGKELKVIWNSFLRGQLFLIAIVIVTYSILLLILGVRYSLALAVLAGLARFVPYLGPLTAWVTTYLVAFFQDTNYFGLEQWFYALLVITICFLVDQAFDQLISPRLMGETLGVHPAALLVVAIMAANLLGVIGLVLAAPVLATLQLAGRYTTRKMLDMDPFPPPTARPLRPERRRHLKAIWRFLRRKIQKRD
jgi:predicted PurR-regulated permease PerM